MNIGPSCTNNMFVSNHPQILKSKKNDLARRMLHDHKFMIEKVKSLESENNRLSKELKLSY